MQQRGSATNMAREQKPRAQGKAWRPVLALVLTPAFVSYAVAQTGTATHHRIPTEAACAGNGALVGGASAKPAGTRSDQSAEKTRVAFEAVTLRVFVERMLPQAASRFSGTGSGGAVWRSMLGEKIAEQIAASGRVRLLPRSATPPQALAKCEGLGTRKTGPSNTIHNHSVQAPRRQAWQAAVVRENESVPLSGRSGAPKD